MLVDASQKHRARRRCALEAALDAIRKYSTPHKDECGLRKNLSGAHGLRCTQALMRLSFRRRYCAALDDGCNSMVGANSLYITGVTKRANKVEVIKPPMMTQASGE